MVKVAPVRARLRDARLSVRVIYMMPASFSLSLYKKDCAVLETTTPRLPEIQAGNVLIIKKKLIHQGQINIKGIGEVESIRHY